MFFGFVFVLYLSVHGQCQLAKGESVQIPSNTFWKASSGSKVLLPKARMMACSIRRNIVESILQTNPKSKLARSQFAYIYLHGQGKKENYDHPDVQRVMIGSQRFPFINPVCPTDAANSNLIISRPLPSSRGMGPEANLGHAERLALDNLEEMRIGFKNRNGGTCPTFAILGTTHDPCNKNGKKGCAPDIVQSKTDFIQEDKCPLTPFFVQVNDPRFQDVWEETKQLFEEHGIGYFTSCEEDGGDTSDSITTQKPFYN